MAVAIKTIIRTIMNVRAGIVVVVRRLVLMDVLRFIRFVAVVVINIVVVLVRNVLMAEFILVHLKRFVRV